MLFISHLVLPCKTHNYREKTLLCNLLDLTFNHLDIRSTLKNSVDTEMLVKYFSNNEFSQFNLCWPDVHIFIYWEYDQTTIQPPAPASAYGFLL